MDELYLASLMDDDIDEQDRAAERAERAYESHLMDMAERGL